ncbi:MAG: hypothetical protein J6V09_04160 [Clostridia bacterium]|nr:hypothetical protein [Clostridia bacterium]
MKFLKENSYDIVRLYINQIGITIFSLLLYFPVLDLKNETTSARLTVVISIFATLFLLALIYTASWEWGAKDKIKIDGGRMEPFRAKGFILGLTANSLNFLLGAVSVISAAICLGGGNALRGVEQVSTIILTMTNSMYIGILELAFSPLAENEALYAFLKALGFFILPMLTVLAAHVGYTLGSKDIRIVAPKRTKK